MSDSQQYCTFFLDGGLFGIEVDRVQEVIRYQDLTRVPHAPCAVSGLINLRGEIVPAIDLRRSLGLAERPDDALPTNVVIRTAEGPVSMLVDDVGDVLEPSTASYEPPPDNLRGATRELIRGVYKLRDGLLMVLATESAIRAATDVPEGS